MSIINRALQKRDERVEVIVVNKEKSVYEEIREREMRKSGRTAGREANMGRKDKMGLAELRKHLCCNRGGNIRRCHQVHKNDWGKR